MTRSPGRRYSRTTSFALLFSRRLTTWSANCPTAGLRHWQSAQRRARRVPTGIPCCTTSGGSRKACGEPRLSCSWRERVRRCNYLRLQFVPRELAWVQGHEELGVRRFSAFAECCIVSIGNVCDLLGDANQLTLFSDQRDNCPRRSRPPRSSQAPTRLDT